MVRREDEELRGLFARLGDLLARSEQGETVMSAFLSPAEQHHAEAFLRGRGATFSFWGGFEDAERKRAYLLPDYMEMGEILTDTLEAYGIDASILTLRITGSGYKTLGHRDFLGALLGLGLERSVLGDISVNEEGTEAFLFCDAVIAGFIESEMQTVGNDKVKICRVQAEECVIPKRRTQPISDTVASPRLDSVVATLCGLSRERARQTVVSGLVELNYESEDRPDRTVASGSTVSVRGFGKYRILSVEDRTKKGRFRLSAEKYL